MVGRNERVGRRVKLVALLLALQGSWFVALGSLPLQSRFQVSLFIM